MNAQASSPASGSAKSAAWDLLGASYWNRDYDGGPSSADCDLYLAGVAAGEPLLLAGASTARLAFAAADLGVALTVCDFSAVMLDDLRQVLGKRADYVLADVCQPGSLPSHRFRAVVADRLLNRFTGAELRAASRTLLGALRVGGEARLSYRLGLYDRDLLVLDHARRRGCLADVFDEAAFDIDYSGARDWLKDVLPAHGSLRPETVAQFYAARGREHRLRPGELDALVAEVCDEQEWKVRFAHIALPGKPGDRILSVRRLR